MKETERSLSEERVAKEKLKVDYEEALVAHDRYVEEQTSIHQANEESLKVL